MDLHVPACFVSLVSVSEVSEWVKMWGDVIHVKEKQQKYVYVREERRFPSLSLLLAVNDADG